MVEAVMDAIVEAIVEEIVEEGEGEGEGGGTSVGEDEARMTTTRDSNQMSVGEPIPMAEGHSVSGDEPVPKLLPNMTHQSTTSSEASPLPLRLGNEEVAQDSVAHGSEVQQVYVALGSHVDDVPVQDL